MRYCVAALVLAAISLCADAGQAKPIEVKPGERYHVESLEVTKDKQKITAQIMQEHFERLLSGTLLEIVKVEPKSDAFPTGYVECKRTNFRGQPEIVFAFPAHLTTNTIKPTHENKPSPPLPPGQPFYRTWKSVDGAFEVSAELLAYDTMKVVLKREKDGKEIQLTPDKLSVADRQWLADLTPLEGNWQCVSIEYMGMVMANPRPEWLAIFQRGKFGLMQGPQMNQHGRIALNSKANPKTIDIIEPSDAKMLGIYQVDNDTLKLTMAPEANDPRPTAFKGAKAGTMTFKRENK